MLLGTALGSTQLLLVTRVNLQLGLVSHLKVTVIGALCLREMDCEQSVACRCPLGE